MQTTDPLAAVTPTGGAGTTPSLPQAPVHPTQGDVTQLRAARAHFDAAGQAVPAAGTGPRPFDPDEVVGGSTVGSLPELAFAHHAHRDGDAATTAGSADGVRQAVTCPCCEG